MRVIIQRNAMSKKKYRGFKIEMQPIKCIAYIISPQRYDVQKGMCVLPSEAADVATEPRENGQYEGENSSWASCRESLFFIMRTLGHAGRWPALRVGRIS